MMKAFFAAVQTYKHPLDHTVKAQLNGTGCEFPNLTFLTYQALLGEPEPEDPLDASIAKMWLENKAQAVATGIFPSEKE